MSTILDNNKDITCINRIKFISHFTKPWVYTHCALLYIYSVQFHTILYPTCTIHFLVQLVVIALNHKSKYSLYNNSYFNPNIIHISMFRPLYIF